MRYDFRCQECDAVQTVDLSISVLDQKKEEGVPCQVCEGTSVFQLNLDSVVVSFKGDAWADKNYREKNYRKQRSSYMAQRQAKNNTAAKLIPNYQGQEAQTWKEVKEAAAADGKNTASYEPLIAKERAATG